MASVGTTQDETRDVLVACLDVDNDTLNRDESKILENQPPTTREAAEADEVEQMHSKANETKQPGICKKQTETLSPAKTNENITEPQLESIVVDVRKPKEGRASSREDELERKVAKLKSTQKQLVEANSEWEKHCEALTRQHEEQAKALTEELHRSKALIKDLQQANSQADRRVQELEQTLVTKQEEWRTEISRLRHEHAHQLELQHGKSTEKEVNNQGLPEQRQEGRQRTMETRIEELERQVHQLSRGQRPGAGSTRPVVEGHHQLATRLRPDASNSDLRTHIAVLQAQISAFKEDFEHEREDRERAEIARDTAQRRLDDHMHDIENLKKLVEQKERENAAVKNQNEYVRQQFTQKCRELESERTSNADLRAELSRLKERPYREQPPYHTCPRDVGVLGSQASTWRCTHCTFDNQHPRVTCEMCGQKAPHAVSGHLATDKQRLLARQMEQSDATRCRHQFCFQDVLEDSPYIHSTY